MHVAYLTGVYIHQDEPWYLNILCVRVTCKRPFLWDKVTIKFLCLFEVRLSNTLSILPSEGWNFLGVFFLTIDVPIEVSAVCLNITNQGIHIQIMLFSYTLLVSLLKGWNVDLSLLLPVFFTFVWVLFFLRIFLLTSCVIQGIEETDLLVFDGICLSAESWMKDVNKSKFFCTERVSEWPLMYFSFAN